MTFVIVHPGTGTIIAASDPVYAIDVDKIPGPLIQDDHDLVNIAERYGYRIDNFNLSNFFYGSDS